MVYPVISHAHLSVLVGQRVALNGFLTGTTDVAWHVGKHGKLLTSVGVSNNGPPLEVL